MYMSFYAGNDVELLFKGFKSKSDEPGKYFGLLLLVFVVAFCIELLSHIRFRIMSKHAANEEQIPVGDKILMCLNYLFSVTLAYGLMLCVMSYNRGVFFATIFGLGVGNHLFFYLK